MALIPAFGRLMQKDLQLEASLGNTYGDPVTKQYIASLKRRDIGAEA
jgi:hypothetical protein